MSFAGQQGATIVKRTSTGVVSAVPCRLVGITVINGAAAVSTVTVNDNASAASGTELAFNNASATSGAAAHAHYGDEGVNMSNGVFATLAANTTAYFLIKT